MLLLDALEARRMLSHAHAAAATTAPTVIDGVQPAALDQPQIHMLLRRTSSGAPLSGADLFGNTSFDVQAFLDTGTSGMLLSQETAQTLGINSSTYKGQPVAFSDAGVAGAEAFDVSESLYAAFAPFTPSADVDNLATYAKVYAQKLGPVRTEISQQPADDLLGPIDIVGMPALAGKVMVVDPTPANTGLDNIRTYIYNAGTPFHSATSGSDPGIPTVGRHVKLSYGNFTRFTTVTPSGAPGPNLAANPFIGPNPVNKLLAKPPADTTPPVTLAQGSLTSKGSFLFDTGAAASFISKAEASNLHVYYKPGTYNTDNPILVDASGNPIPNQFQLPLGGIGGQLNAAGFYVDSLTLPTTEGKPIKFTHAPVLVADVSVQDPVTKQSLTLDGDFGMNFLVASTDISTGLLGETRAGAFSWITFDQSKGLLGLQLAGSTTAAAANSPSNLTLANLLPVSSIASSTLDTSRLGDVSNLLQDLLGLLS
jgi:hypothetical protein